jgi:hypothetical protein
MLLLQATVCHVLTTQYFETGTLLKHALTFANNMQCWSSVTAEALDAACICNANKKHRQLTTHRKREVGAHTNTH